MSTRVLNLRVSRMQPGDVRIDRKTALGNPFIIGRDGSRADVIAQYETKLRADLAAGRVRAQDVAALHGKRLFCWCAPLPCHGHVLARVAAELQQSTAGLQATQAAPQPATRESELDHISELAERYDLGMVSAAHVPSWRRDMVDTAARAFDLGATSAAIAARGQGFFPATWKPHTPAGWDVVEA